MLVNHSFELNVPFSLSNTEFISITQSKTPRQPFVELT